MITHLIYIWMEVYAEIEIFYFFYFKSQLLCFYIWKKYFKYEYLFLNIF